MAMIDTVAIELIESTWLVLAGGNDNDSGLSVGMEIFGKECRGIHVETAARWCTNDFFKWRLCKEKSVFTDY